MPLFGAHMSVAGGLYKAVNAATALGCETMQIFTRNPNSWDPKPLSETEIRDFRQALAASELKFPTAHDSYLINLGAPDEKHFQRSIDALTAEMERAEALGLSYLVSHPGAHNDRGEEGGLARVISGLNEVHRRCAGFNVVLLIETTAGQGSTLGYKFEHISTLLNGVENTDWLGVCLDTCHIFVAGYALNEAEEYGETFAEFDRIVGIDRLKVFHVNDSVREKGSKVDRHANLGQGEIRLDVFSRLVNDPRFSHLPMILETPKEDDAGTAMDPVNLGILREFLAE